MKRIGKIVVTLVTVLLLVLTVACAPTLEEVTPPPTPELTPTVERGIIEIRVTDPPPPGVTSANVTLTNIEVHREGGGWETIIIDEATFDLLDVVGVTEVLGSANVTAGSFTQIRMDIDSVEVVSATGDNITAEVPSGKLRIVRPFTVEDSVKTILTLDFDGAKSLIITGAGKALFKPVVKLLREYEELPE